MIKKFFFSAITALVIIGCIGTTHNFKVRFNDIQGLRENDQVYFDKTAIGKVTNIEYTDTGSYLISIAVEDQFSSLPKDTSTFYIDSNPDTESQKVLRIIQIRDGGNKIEKRAIVDGQSKYASIYGQIANKFRKNIHAMEFEINEFLNGFQNLSESEQIKQIERQLDEILAEIDHLSVEMRHKFKTEILPNINEQIEKLRRQLEELGKEEKLKYVDQKIETIYAEL
jgi:ABC-type transporter Mla subunit MlaD